MQNLLDCFHPLIMLRIIIRKFIQMWMNRFYTYYFKTIDCHLTAV